MGLFKKRGKHVRSAKKKADAVKAVEEEAIEPSDAGAEGEEPEVEVEVAAVADASDEEELQDNLNKPESIDGPVDDDSSDEGDSETDESDEPNDDADEDADDGDDREGADELSDSDETVALDPIEDADAELDEDGSTVYEPLSNVDESGFKSANIKEVSVKKKRRGLKVFGITMGVIVVLVCVAYIAGAVVFMGRFLPNTVIGEHDISLKSDSEVIGMLEDVADSYQIDVVGNNGFSYRATGSDVGLSINAADVVAAMHNDLNAWTWPALIIQSKHDESDQMVVKFDSMAYEAKVTEAVNKFNESATPPTNATIAFDEATNKFIVKEEVLGTQLDPAAVLLAFDEGVEALQSKVVVGEDELLQPTVLSTDEKLIESAQLATGMVSAKLTLVMGGKPVGEVSGESLSKFVTIDDKLEVTFKTEDMDAWIDELTSGFNTVGTERVYTRADGKEIRVSGGVYGWEIDKEALKTSLLDGIKSGATAQVEVPCAETADVYNGAGQRDWGNRYLDVDITEQHVRFYGDDGSIIWETDCITGMPDGTHDTVPGVWYVNAKESPSKLIGYENGKKIYETTVTFWMPFEGNGIGFHDATWQPSFGGTMYANGYGSHGCVNLSYSAAQELYGLIKEGDPVVVHG